MAKVIRFDKLAPGSERQEGKDITVYMGDDHLIHKHRRHISGFMTELHQKMESVIAPPQLPGVGELPLWGSSRISYTNDLGRSGRALDAAQRQLEPNNNFIGEFPGPNPGQVIDERMPDRAGSPVPVEIVNQPDDDPGCCSCQ